MGSPPTDAPKRDELTYDADVGLADRLRKDGHQYVQALTSWLARQPQARLRCVPPVPCRRQCCHHCNPTNLPPYRPRHPKTTQAPRPLPRRGRVFWHFHLDRWEQQASGVVLLCLFQHVLPLCLWQARCSQAALSIFSCVPSSAMAVPIHVVSVGLSTSFFELRCEAPALKGCSSPSVSTRAWDRH